MTADLKRIYTSVTLDEAEENLLQFSEKWRKQYPSCVKSWEEYWDVLTNPPEIRKIIYTMNTIEGLNRQFRQITEVYCLVLSCGSIAVYGYLLYIENRKTCQSYVSCKTIGRAVKMSANTVRKYVSELRDRRLIRTEYTTIVTRDGHKRNGTLRYYIRPIQEAVDYYHERQLSQLEMDTERQRAQARLSRLCAAQVAKGAV